MVMILRTTRCRWLGHVMRLDILIPARTAMNCTAPDGKIERGRPNTTLPRTIEKELETGALRARPRELPRSRFLGDPEKLSDAKSHNKHLIP